MAQANKIGFLQEKNTKDVHEKRLWQDIAKRMASGQTKPTVAFLSISF